MTSHSKSMIFLLYKRKDPKILYPKYLECRIFQNANRQIAFLFPNAFNAWISAHNSGFRIGAPIEYAHSMLPHHSKKRHITLSRYIYFIFVQLLH